MVQTVAYPLYCGGLYNNFVNLDTNSIQPCKFVTPRINSGSYAYMYYHYNTNDVIQWLFKNKLQIEAYWFLTNNISLLKAIGFYDNVVKDAAGRIGKNRTPEEYYRDLIASWFLEDIFVNNINQLPEIKLWYNGTDAQRFLQENIVSNKADFCIVSKQTNKRLGYIELVSNFSPKCYNGDFIHLRNKKYEHLLEYKEPLFLLILDYSQTKFCLIKKEMLFNYKPTYIHYIDSFGKDGIRLTIPKEVYKPINLLYETIKKYIINQGA